MSKWPGHLRWREYRWMWLFTAYKVLIMWPVGAVFFIPYVFALGVMKVADAWGIKNSNFYVTCYKKDNRRRREARKSGQ